VCVCVCVCVCARDVYVRVSVHACVRKGVGKSGQPRRSERKAGPCGEVELATLSKRIVKLSSIAIAIDIASISALIKVLMFLLQMLKNRERYYYVALYKKSATIIARLYTMKQEQK